MAQIREHVKTMLHQRTSLDYTVISDLEIGIYNWAIEFANKHMIIKNWASKPFINVYIDKARSIISNLDQTGYIKNTNLITRVNNNEFKPHQLPFMSYDVTFPELWKETIEKKKKREESVYEDKIIASTTLYRCGRCGGRECSYFEKQTRSCDEPTTVFLTCLNPACGNKWKI